jgi:hypothetical protein
MALFIKIFLIVLLFICLFEMPYGYFQFVRFACFFGFVYLALVEKKADSGSIAFIYAFLALLFQPFIKIALGRFIWNIVDVSTAILLLGTIIYEFSGNRLKNPVK